MPVALLLAVLAAAPVHPPDVQVTARTLADADATELVRAINRALVATGATVVMASNPGTPCRGARCVRLVIEEERPGRFRVEARQPGHFAAAAVEVPRDATVFERARAVAVQARLLIDWPLEDPSPAPVAATPPRRTLPPAPALTAPAPAVEPLPAVAPPVEPPPAPPAAVAPPPEPVHPRPLVPAAVTAPAPAPAGAPAWAWVSTLGGAGAGVAAGVFALLANDRYQALSDRSIPVAEARRYRDEGKRYQTTGLVLGGVAVAGLATGAAGFWLEGAPTPDGGATVGIAGSLP